MRRHHQGLADLPVANGQLLDLARTWELQVL